MGCSELVSLVLVVVVVYFVLRKIISRVRIDRYTDVYVLITGCDTGFGNEAAKRFDRMGCHVFAGCFTEKGKESLKEECSDRVHAISLDVTKIESIREAYDYIKANLPKGRGSQLSSCFWNLIAIVDYLIQRFFSIFISSIAFFVNFF